MHALPIHRQLWPPGFDKTFVKFLEIHLWLTRTMDLRHAIPTSQVGDGLGCTVPRRWDHGQIQGVVEHDLPGWSLSALA